MLLGWDQHQLANASKISVGTIKRLEAKSGVIGGTMETAMKIRSALEKAGIVFIQSDADGGAGVRLSKSIE